MKKVVSLLLMMGLMMPNAAYAAASPSLNSQTTSKEVVIMVKKAKSGTKVYASKKVFSRKKLAKAYASKSKTVVKALKGEKLDRSVKKQVKKLKKLTSSMARLYIKKGKKSSSVKLTFKVNNLTKKAKKVYILRYDASKKKWFLTKTKVNYKKKTVSVSLKNLGTYALVYTK